MKILIACEFSGVVREAFNAYHGNHAISCDLLPPEDGRTDYHYQGDVRDILNDGWDMMIAFPPCTYICSSGLHWNKRRPERQKLTDEALDFVRLLMNAPIPKIAIENPIGCISTQIRKQDQIIQPWMFGHPERKATCLWLKNLPPLNHTKIIPPKGYKQIKFASEMPLCPDCNEEAYCEEHQKHFADCDCYGPTQDGIFYKTINGYMFGTEQENLHPLWNNQTPSGQNNVPPSPTQWMERSRTYPGIAAAMAEQWTPQKDKDDNDNRMFLNGKWYNMTRKENKQ